MTTLKEILHSFPSEFEFRGSKFTFSIEDEQWWNGGGNMDSEGNIGIIIVPLIEEGVDSKQDYIIDFFVKETPEDEYGFSYEDVDPDKCYNEALKKIKKGYQERFNNAVTVLNDLEKLEYSL